MSHLGHLHDREDSARFVVGPHNRDQCYIVVEPAFILVKVKAAFLIDAEPDDCIAFLLKLFADRENGWVLNSSCYDRCAFRLRFDRRHDGR